MEMEIIEAAARLEISGVREFYGYMLARELGIKNKSPSEKSGAIYRALRYLERTDRVKSRLETLEEYRSREGKGPLRKYYSLVGS